MNYLVNDAKELGGTTERTETSKFVVSAWHIPGGYEYDRATIYELFFEDKEPAEKLEAKYRDIPEMAALFDLSDPRVKEFFDNRSTSDNGTTRGSW